MENLFIILGFFLFVSVLSFFANRWINSKRREDKKNLSGDLENFRDACKLGDIYAIKEAGIKLVQNVHITKGQLQEVTDSVNPLIYIHEETLKELIDEIVNKWAHFNRGVYTGG